MYIALFTRTAAGGSASNLRWCTLAAGTGGCVRSEIISRLGLVNNNNNNDSKSMRDIMANERIGKVRNNTGIISPLLGGSIVSCCIPQETSGAMRQLLEDVAICDPGKGKWRRHRWKARNKRKRLPKLIRVPTPPHRLYK